MHFAVLSVKLKLLSCGANHNLELNLQHKMSSDFLLSFLQTYVDILKSISKANLPDIVITLISLPSLLIVKYLSERHKKKLRNIPIPIELILVVAATMVSHFCHLEKAPYNVNTVKTIPTG